MQGCEWTFEDAHPQAFSERLKTKLQWYQWRGVELLLHIPASAAFLVGATLGSEISLLHHSGGKSGCLVECSLDSACRSRLILRRDRIVVQCNFDPEW